MRKKYLPGAGIFFLMIICLLANRSLAQYQLLYDFTTYADGVNPFGSLVSDGTNFYGMASSGGSSTFGVIFKTSLTGTGYTKLIEFTGTTGNYLGSNPEGSLIYDGTFLYGMTTSGGANSNGTIFKVKPDGTGFLSMYSFTNSDGSQPFGSLITDGTWLYGMSSGGGSSSYGTLFKIKTDGTGFLKFMDFTGPDGNTAYGDLYYDGTFLYGGTFYGGGTGCYGLGCGMIFKVKPDGTGFDTIKVFSGANGQGPHGTLISDGTYLYGTTSAGGAHIQGTIFKIKPDGTGYADLHDFSGYTTPDGAAPFGSLVSVGAYLYGMTNSGGASDLGSIFKIKPDGTGYADIHDFGTTGANSPYGSLINVGGNLYGMTKVGSFGTVFEYQLAPSAINETNAQMPISVLPNPFMSEIRISSSTKGEAILYDIAGKEILHQNIAAGETIINAEKISAGIYLLNYTDGNSVTTTKLLKM